MRKAKFINNDCHHIFNRGTDKRKIFLDDFDYERFLLTMKVAMSVDIGGMMKYRNLTKNNATRAQLLVFYQELSSGSKLVDIIAYCLNPNHYHFILMQREDDGITKFMHKLSTSYTNYFNCKHKRSGSLFQGRFKSAHIDSNEYLLYLSAYVNGNNFIHKHNENIESWPYCSYPDYIGKRKGNLCNKDVILSQFKDNKQDYKEFCDINMDYLRDKKEFEKYLME
jgi:REP-associated tyrosine transposase